MYAEVIRLTKAGDSGFVTFYVEAPKFLLSQISRHRKIALSAESRRAVAPIGWYEPPVFRKQGRFMTSGAAYDEEDQRKLRLLWRNYHAKLLDELDKIRERFPDLTKEQINRLLPESFECRFYLSASLGEFMRVSRIRSAPEADVAARELFAKLNVALEDAEAVKSLYHTPYALNVQYLNVFYAAVIANVALIARVSTRNQEIRRGDEIKFAKRLWERGETSPFEHFAYFDTDTKKWINAVDGIREGYFPESLLQLYFEEDKGGTSDDPRDS